MEARDKAQYREPWSYELYKSLRFRIRQFILRLFARPAPGMTSSEDDTCLYDCECGARLWLSGSIYWCRACGRGYFVDFRVMKIPAMLRYGEAEADRIEAAQDAEREARYLKMAQENMERWRREHGLDE